MDLISIRGATTSKTNSKKDILDATKDLLLQIQKNNDFKTEDVLSILFSCTNDLTKVYPARAARELGYLETSLMCFQEMHVENSLEKCIRVSILCKTNKIQKNVKHIYLREAKKLRPDRGGSRNG